MPRTAALNALIKAYRDQISWLAEKAKGYESAAPDVAADFLHRANNLQAIIDAYERLEAKEAAASAQISAVGVTSAKA